MKSSLVFLFVLGAAIAFPVEENRDKRGLLAAAPYLAAPAIATPLATPVLAAPLAAPAIATPLATSWAPAITTHTIAAPAVATHAIATPVIAHAPLVW